VGQKRHRIDRLDRLRCLLQRRRRVTMGLRDRPLVAKTASRGSAARARVAPRPRTAILLKARAAQARQAWCSRRSPKPILLVLLEGDAIRLRSGLAPPASGRSSFGHSGRFRD
jgi:hypothetical protein